MADIDSVSSCGPQAKAQPPPPMAHAPMPMGVRYMSLLPNCLVCMSVSYDSEGTGRRPVLLDRDRNEGLALDAADGRYYRGIAAGESRWHRHIELIESRFDQAREFNISLHASDGDRDGVRQRLRGRDQLSGRSCRGGGA